MLDKLLGSKLRAKVLGWFFLHPDERYFVRQLHGLIGEDATNLSRELARLEGMGILVSKMEGRQKYYQTDPNCPIRDELRSIAAKTVGLADVLRAALGPIQSDISVAFIYGSQATGKVTAGSDVDLFVVGDVDEMKLHKAVTRAERRLGRAVNYRLMSPAEYEQKSKEKTGFLARVMAGQKIPVLRTPDEL
jgi:DNA-binding transcriptional ArsR family regulator